MQFIVEFFSIQCMHFDLIHHIYYLVLPTISLHMDPFLFLVSVFPHEAENMINSVFSSSPISSTSLQMIISFFQVLVCMSLWKPAVQLGCCSSGFVSFVFRDSPSHWPGTRWAGQRVPRILPISVSQGVELQSIASCLFLLLLLICLNTGYDDQIRVLMYTYQGRYLLTESSPHPPHSS